MQVLTAFTIQLYTDLLHMYEMIELLVILNQLYCFSLCEVSKMCAFMCVCVCVFMCVDG